MKLWATLIIAMDPIDGEYKEFAGPCIPAPTKELAFDYCQKYGLGYCMIEGRIIAEIPMKDGEPDYDNLIDYELRDLN